MTPEMPESPARPIKTPKRRRVITAIIIILVLAIALLLMDSYSRVVSTEFKLNYVSLPQAFDGFRIVVLSDIHAAVFGNDNSKIIEMTTEAAPDIIAVTGDFIDGTGKKSADEQLAVAKNLTEKLVKIAPVYFVTGNHEWASGRLWDLLPILEDLGVHVLRNEYESIELGGESLIIAGTDDPNGPYDMEKPADFIRRIHEEEGGKFIVLLEHRNHHLELYGELGVDLVLCGHAHGGIIRLPFTDGLFGPGYLFPKHTNGVYTRGGTTMVVSRGIGNHTGLPRFLNNPQVVTVELRS